MSAAAEIVRLDAATLGSKIAAKELSSAEITRACLDQIAATDETYHAFLHVAADDALATAAKVDAKVAKGEPLPSPLAGVPLALKDVFTTTDMPTTCGSKILEGWTSPYDATVTARIRRRVLDANGIRQRYYALDEQGEPTELGDVPDERQGEGGDAERGGDQRHREGATAHLGRIGLALRLEGPGVPATGADGVLDGTRVILERVHGFGHRIILASVGCGSR